MSKDNAFYIENAQILKNGKVIFTPSQIQLLSKINRLHRKIGNNFSLMSQASIDSMIIESLQSQQAQIKEEIDNFFDTLPAPVQAHYQKMFEKDIDKIKNTV